MSSRGLTLIVFPIILLSGVGIIYNNFVNSGLNPNVTLVCNSIGDCYNSNAVGCQNVTCQFGALSFLNGNSPFTFLFTGNIFGFWSALTTNGNANRGPFDPTGGGNSYSVNCWVSGVVAHTTNYTSNVFWSKLLDCTETNPDGSNMTSTQARTSIIFPNWNTNYFTGSPSNMNFYHMNSNATDTLSCYDFGWWYITNNPTIGYAMAGCDYGGGSWPLTPPTTNARWSVMLAIPARINTTAGLNAQSVPAGDFHVLAYAQPEAWETQLCPSLATSNYRSYFYSQQCINGQNWFSAPQGANALNAGFFTPFLTFLVGVILFFLALGLNMKGGGSIFGSGTQFGIGSNPQGTKLAQVIGLGLIIWSVLYSEFGTWINTSLLPYGLDSVVLIFISGMFFFGLYDQLTSGVAPPS